MDSVYVDKSGGGYRVTCETASLAAAMKAVSLLLEIRESAFADAKPATLNLPATDTGD